MNDPPSAARIAPFERGHTGRKHLTLAAYGVDFTKQIETVKINNI